MTYQDAVRQVVSRPGLQPLWTKLLKLCHAGMNYGGGQATLNSGEIGALAFAAKTFPAGAPVVIFDVGAHDGEYIEAVQKVLPAAGTRIYSFEPLPSTFGVLEERYGKDPMVTLRNAAMGAETGTVDMFFAGDGLTTASLHAAKTGDVGASVPVEVTTVDTVCADAGVSAISYLKIDTEGHEMDVLAGSKGMIAAGAVHAIQFEFGDTFLQTNHHFQDIFALLVPDYRIYRILRQGVYEVTSYTHDLEVYKLSNFLCMRR